MMRFPITDLLSEEASFKTLLDVFHDGVLRCPKWQCLSGLNIKEVTENFLKALMIPGFTYLPT